MEAQHIYTESFSQKSEIWKVGKNKEADDTKEIWHQNIFGYYGCGRPLKWLPYPDKPGGFASSESPWYFDDNHGQWGWLNLIAHTRTEAAGISGVDLRDCYIKLVIRGRDLKLNGTRLFFHIQGYGGKKGFYTGEVLYNWALNSQPVDEVLTDGSWHEVVLKLNNDELKWGQLGLVPGPMPHRIRIVQSLSAADGFLDGVLAGKHYSIGFILGGIHPLHMPEGCIDFALISIYR